MSLNKATFVSLLAICFAPLLTAQEGPKIQELILPIVVNGRINDRLHFQTEVIFLNLSDSSARPAVTVFDNTGKEVRVFTCPLPIPHGPTPLDPLSPLGLLWNVTDAYQAVLTTGWARINWNTSAVLQARAEIYLMNSTPACIEPSVRTSDAFITSSEIPAVKAAKEFRSQINYLRQRKTAFAIVNPSSTQTAKVLLTVLNFDGAVPLGCQAELAIAPQNRVAKFIDEIFPQFPSLPCISCFPCILPGKGSVKITSDVPIAVGALDIVAPKGEFISVPVTSTEPWL